VAGVNGEFEDLEDRYIMFEAGAASDSIEYRLKPDYRRGKDV